MFGNAGGSNASQTSSVVAVDPLDPTKLVSVWIDNDPSELPLTDNEIQGVLEAAYSVNAGQSWLPLLGEPTNGLGIPSDPELLNPATSVPTVPFEFVSTPSLGFDDSGNFYILSEYSNASTPAASSTGAVVLQKYGFTGSTPAAQDVHDQPAGPRIPTAAAAASVRGVQPQGGLPVAWLGHQ